MTASRGASCKVRETASERMGTIRQEWEKQVGEPSHLVVEIRVEVSFPGSVDPTCTVQGRVGVPSMARTVDERNHLAGILVSNTILPELRPTIEMRILNLTTKRLDSSKCSIDVREGGLSMPKFMWWEKEYVENRYMKSLPMKDLNQRFFDIIVNSQDISQGGKIGIRMGTRDINWMRYFQHVTTEARMRDLPFPLFLDKRYEPDYGKDAFNLSVKGGHSTRASNRLSKPMADNNDKFHVVKYGERQFMEAFIRDGQMLISPSRRFDDVGLNQALRDDENSITVFGARTSDGKVIPAHHLPNWWGDRYSMIDFSSSIDRDYMLYCMARSLSPTLFSHFGNDYDACVLIQDIDEFVRRVYEGTKNAFPPSAFHHEHGYVTYIDPLGAIEPIQDVPAKSKPTIPFLKHFKHSYQEEFRFVWLPKQCRRNLQKVCISIGSLADIAELVLL